MSQDQEIKEVREILPEPQKFEDGFTLKTVIGAFFISLFMLPGGMYLGLVAGQGVGEAAEWVTIVLFAEVARRSYNPLKKQEIYVLFYIAAGLTSVVNIERGLGGGPFSQLIWNAYFAVSPAAKGIANQIPTWAVPPGTSAAITHRELWHPDWWVPIGLLVLAELMGRLSWMGLGYTLFRITSDVEKLPFPYAPVAASGATALSEAGSESWRWNIFSAGTVIGLLFGFVYVGIPVLSGSLFGQPLQVLPIPFADYTRNIETVLPAAIIGISFSLGNILIGFVLPFEIVAGACAASVLAMIVANPILHSFGLLPTYKFGSDALLTKLTVDMDFWLSIGIGVNLSIAVIGIALVIKAFREARRNRGTRGHSIAPPAGRGDIPVYIAVCAWLFATITLILVSHRLVPQFPIWILVFFGLVWSPLNSYISARMIGLTGRGVAFPYLKEASVVASGYKRVDVWYAPMPLADYGWAAQRFREVELTGTKFTSILKAEALMFPLVLIASFLFWSFFWNSTVLPTGQFPYAQKFWPVQSTSQSVIMQINAPQDAGAVNWFAKAIDPLRIAVGTAGGLVLFGICSLVKIPVMFFYGFAGGIGLLPANTVPQFLGAWFGKKVMAKRYGEDQWIRYAPVLLAGFSCGTGLVSMASIGLALITKAVTKMPY